MKKLFSVLLVALLLIVMGGCSNNEEEKPLTDPIKKVGIVQLVKHDALDAATQGFIDELEKEFSNIVIDSKVAGDASNCPVIVDGFVVDGYDLIMANATPALQAAQSATIEIPIIGTSVTEYGVALGIDNFSGVTGINVSGTSDLAPLDEQANMIIDLIPNVKKVGIIYCSSEANSKYQVDVISDLLKAKGIEVDAQTFKGSDDIAGVLESLCAECDALYIPTDNQAASCAETIANEVYKTKTPIICGEEGTCKYCGVATLTIDYYNLGVVTGKMAGKVLKGEAKIEEMEISYDEQPVKKFNKEIAELCGIQIPSDYVEIVVE